MSNLMIFIAGVMLGNLIGMFIMALLVAASRSGG